MTARTRCAILSRMLIKVRRLGAAFSAPKVSEVNGTLVLQAEMLGELVKLPESLRDEGELIVGELSMSFMPVGIEVQLGDADEKLNLSLIHI